ncbi:MAG: aldo/keto reductase [Gammaproteobacteria bacterium]|nr:aldo/keto reductase [Gammaproteobacteria bacterium]
MKTKKLGRSDLEVTQLCLGSMTWGSVQNDEADGHTQISHALANGINFMDTAEMYPVNPVSAETCGNTEIIIGNWFANNGQRDKWIVATKIAGYNKAFIRPGQTINEKTIVEAVEGSLKRLQTDYIDLYQLHWPDRGSYHFRQNWSFDPTAQPRDQAQNMEAVLRAADRLVKEGKVRYLGLSNESAWGTAKWLEVSEKFGLPRMQTIQNEYSLLCRLYDNDLGELSHQEEVDLICYSPLACGLLSGKYADGTIPAGTRRSLNENLNGRMTDNAVKAIDGYLAVAAKYGLNPTQMALAWCMRRPFMGSVIFGATSIAQLDEVMGADSLELSDEVMTEIAEVHRTYPMPY